MTKTFVIFLLAILGSATALSPHRTYGNRRSLSETACRGEETCLKQVCNPAAYQYDLSTAGLDFPYSVSYTTTGSDTTTSFVFNVCNTDAAHKDCAPGIPGCAPLKAVLLRIRDDAIESGHGITANPAGQMWASCSPYGPGHLWDATSLGPLSTTRAKNAACTPLTVTVTGKGAVLSDICQQGIVIKDNSNTTIFDQSTIPSSCLFVLEEQNGRVAYGTVIDRVARSAVSATTTPSASATSSPASASKPTAYGRRLRHNSKFYSGRNHAAQRLF